MKYICIILFLFILSCSGNKVTNYHGPKQLENKFDKLEINVTNKNDILKIIGPPSTISMFDQNKWYYIETLKTNQSIIKLGSQKLKKNNVLIVRLNNYGILVSKKILDLNDMNSLKYLEKNTEKDFEENNILFGVLSSLKEKINSPARNRSK